VSRRPGGSGSVAIFAGWFPALRPELVVTIANRGVSGDRIAELLARWQTGCLVFAPTVRSLRVGVPDVWRKAATWNGQPITLPDYIAASVRRVNQARAGGVRAVILSERGDLLALFGIAIGVVAAITWGRGGRR
jgi:hypothetical protein